MNESIPINNFIHSPHISVLKQPTLSTGRAVTNIRYNGSKTRTRAGIQDKPVQGLHIWTCSHLLPK